MNDGVFKKKEKKEERVLSFIEYFLCHIIIVTVDEFNLSHNNSSKGK